MTSPQAFEGLRQGPGAMFAAGTGLTRAVPIIILPTTARLDAKGHKIADMRSQKARRSWKQTGSQCPGFRHQI